MRCEREELERRWMEKDRTEGGKTRREWKVEDEDEEEEEEVRKRREEGKWKKKSKRRRERGR